MNDVYTIRQVMEAAGVTRRQIDIWVSRGYLHLDDNPPNGEARKYTLLDTINIATMAETARLGIPATRFWGGASGIPGFFAGQRGGLLLIWQGPGPGYNPIEPMLQAEICSHEQVAAKVLAPERRATVVIDLEALEHRVRASLEKSGGARQGELRARLVSPIDSTAIYAGLNKAGRGSAE